MNNVVELHPNEQYEEKQLFNDVCSIIDTARTHVATYANTETLLMNWNVGKRIKEDVLFNHRAEYGQQIVKRLANLLVERYGTGWKDRKLLHCIRAAYTFTEDEIVYAARIQLTWTHLRSIMFIEDPLARQFYIEMTRIKHWDTRTLADKADLRLFSTDRSVSRSMP